MIRPAIIGIVQETRLNSFYRRVIETSAMSQLVVMTIPAFSEIGEEMHQAVEQSIFIVEGSGTVFFNRRSAGAVGPGDVIVIPPRTTHNLKAGREPIRLFTTYTPPNHIDGVVHRTRADAEADVRDQEFGRQVERRARR